MADSNSYSDSSSEPAERNFCGSSEEQDCDKGYWFSHDVCDCIREHGK